MSIDELVMEHIDKTVLAKVEEIEQAERKRILEQVRRLFVDWSLSGELPSKFTEQLTKLEAGE